MTRWLHGQAEAWLRWKVVPRPQSLGGRQENLFLHADVTKQPGLKLIIHPLIDRTSLNHSRLQQPSSRRWSSIRKCVQVLLFRSLVVSSVASDYVF